MKDEEDDFEDVETDGDDTAPDIDVITLGHRPNRPRRSWRDIERLREQRELDRLMTDDWFDELDKA